jgi:hypothetical protein
MKSININQELSISLLQQDSSEKLEKVKIGTTYIYPALKQANSLLKDLSFEELFLASRLLAKVQNAIVTQEQETLIENEEHRFLVRLLKEHATKLLMVVFEWTEWVAALDKKEDVKVKVVTPVKK